ncbi:hypothetical protein Lal_00012178 [Lupinus albus]|nr:hypothetical protein Lal_00012178 [Lupinus albus]
MYYLRQPSISMLKILRLVFLINGSHLEEIRLKRDLRQSDPLSPFLFLIAAEGFAGLMREATSLGFFTPYSVGSDYITVSLLRYANDAILIGDCSGKNVWVMKGPDYLPPKSLLGRGILNVSPRRIVLIFIGSGQILSHRSLIKRCFRPIILIHGNGNMNKSKQYIVRSAYKLLSLPTTPQISPYQHSHLIWKSKAPLQDLGEFIMCCDLDLIAELNHLPSTSIEMPILIPLSCTHNVYWNV